MSILPSAKQAEQACRSESTLKGFFSDVLMMGIVEVVDGDICIYPTIGGQRPFFGTTPDRMQ